MTATRLILSMMSLPLTAIPSEAQRLTPVALRGSDTSMTIALPQPVPSLEARRDTQPASRSAFNPLGGVAVGLLGGIVGTFAGGYIGALSAAGCHGEFCGLGSALTGAGIGESIGVALGTHFGSGSRRHENIMLTSLTSAGILVGGTLLGVAMNRAGVVMLPLTPALQLAAALAIERQ